MLTPHNLPVTWSRKSRAIPLLPLWDVRPVQSLSAYTRVHFTFILTYRHYVGFLLYNISGIWFDEWDPKNLGSTVSPEEENRSGFAKRFYSVPTGTKWRKSQNPLRPSKRPCRWMQYGIRRLTVSRLVNRKLQKAECRVRAAEVQNRHGLSATDYRQKAKMYGKSNEWLRQVMAQEITLQAK